MSNKEKLAEDYAEPISSTYDIGIGTLNTHIPIKRAFIAGYETAEQEMIRFAEWCNEKCYSYSYMRMQWDNAEQTESFTTQQLLNKFREHNIN